MAAQEAIEAATIIAESLKHLAEVALRHEGLELLAFMLDQCTIEAVHAAHEISRAKPS